MQQTMLECAFKLSDSEQRPNKNTKDITNPVAQRVAAPTEMTVKVQLTVSISPNTASATNISQLLRLDAEAPKFYPAGGCSQGQAKPRAVVAPR